MYLPYLNSIKGGFHLGRNGTRTVGTTTLHLVPNLLVVELGITYQYHDQKFDIYAGIEV